MLRNTGPVKLRDEWPQPLKDLSDALGESFCDESTIQLHCLCRGWDPEYVWRMKLAPGMFEKIERQWRLSRTFDPAHFKMEGYESRLSGLATPEWWSPKDDGNTSFYVSAQVLARGKSDRFHVAVDKKRETVFVYWWFNF